MEKRRERKEIKVTQRRRGGIKRGESKLASNHFPMCSPWSGSFRDVHRDTQRKEEGDKGGQGGIKRRETDLASNQFPKYSPQPRIPKGIHRVE